MTENANHHHHRRGPAESPRTNDPFSLEAYLERQWAEFADGPTMAEILARADARRGGGVPREIIAATVREDRDA
jgi:hypothetical protein